MWPVEEIPDAHSVFMRVHFDSVSDGAPMPGAFRDRCTGMSTDWEKYADPEQTRDRGRKPAAEYGVIELPVSDVRAISGLSVVHEPLDDNRAHSGVHGIKSNPTKYRVLLVRISQWAIEYDG